MRIKRAPLWGRALYTLTIILLLLTTSSCIYTKNKYDELKEVNASIITTIDEQKEIIEKLEAEKNNLNVWAQQLQERNKQLESRLYKQQTENKPQMSAQTETTSNGNKDLGTFKISAYCHCSKCCGKSDGVTATGTKVQANRTIAVDPKVIPLGSKVIIDGKTYVAEDTGGNIKGNRIDMYFPTHQEALNWGVRSKNVILVG